MTRSFLFFVFMVGVMNFGNVICAGADLLLHKMKMAPVLQSLSERGRYMTTASQLLTRAEGSLHEAYANSIAARSCQTCSKRCLPEERLDHMNASKLFMGRAQEQLTMAKQIFDQAGGILRLAGGPIGNSDRLESFNRRKVEVCTNLLLAVPIY